MRTSLLTVPAVRKVKQGAEPLVKVVSKLVNFLSCHEAWLVHPLGREGWTAHKAYWQSPCSPPPPSLTDPTVLLAFINWVPLSDTTRAGFP